MIVHPTTSFLRSEREWDGQERTLGTRLFIQILENFEIFYPVITSFLYASTGAHFFLSLSPYKDLYRDHLTVTQGGKSCFSCTSPFYFRWALQEFCNRCFRDICLKFTGYLLFYMLLQFRLKSFFFQHHCDCVYGKSSGNHDLLQKAYPVSIEINPTVIGL